MNHTKGEGFNGEKAIITPYVIRDMQAGNAITKQLYVTHIGYYPQARHHFRERQRGTPENILIYCESGAGWITFAGERYDLRESQFFILPANEPHAYGADERNPWSIYWIHFLGDNVPMFASLMGKLNSLSLEKGEQSNSRIKLFDKIFDNLSMGYAYENLEYATFCLMYFLSSLKYIAQYEESIKTPSEDIIQRSIYFMRERVEKKITLKDIADAVGYSSTHLNALFVKGTSFSPMEYFNQLKIQRVCYYLQFSGLKIKEIAFKLGFYDPFHLSRAFVKEMQISPREYRKRYRVSHDAE